EPGDGRRVEGHVVARAEAELEDVAREPRADPAAQRLHLLAPAPDVDHPWQDVLAVETHRGPPYGEAGAPLPLVRRDARARGPEGLRPPGPGRICVTSPAFRRAASRRSP